MAITDALRPASKTSAWEKLPLVPISELCSFRSAAESHDWAARHGVELHLDWRGRLVITQPDALRIVRDEEAVARAELQRREKQERAERAEVLKWQRAYQDAYRAAWINAKADGGPSGITAARTAARGFLEQKVPQNVRYQLADPKYVMNGTPPTGAELYPGEE